MDEQIWKIIEDQFRRFPNAMAAPVDALEFDGLIGVDGRRIDKGYREFVLRFGGGIVGAVPIYGLRRAKFMGTIGGAATALEVTEWFRRNRWPGVEKWLLFSSDQGGNPIGFDTDGMVWLSDQLDYKQVVQLASSFEEYLRKWCLMLGGEQ